MMEGFDFLKRLPLFEELSLEDLKSLYHLCELRPFSFGEALIRAGQPAPALFILVEGVLDVRSAATAKAAPGTVARLQPGAHLGELGLIDDSPSNVDVVAAAPGRVLRLDKVGLQRALAASDALAVKIFRVFLRTMAARLRETTARLGPVGA